MFAQGSLGLEVRREQGLFAQNAEEAFDLVEPGCSLACNENGPVDFEASQFFTSGVPCEDELSRITWSS